MTAATYKTEVSQPTLAEPMIKYYHPHVLPTYFKYWFFLLINRTLYLSLTGKSFHIIFPLVEKKFKFWIAWDEVYIDLHADQKSSTNVTSTVFFYLFFAWTHTIRMYYRKDKIVWYVLLVRQQHKNLRVTAWTVKFGGRV